MLLLASPAPAAEPWQLWESPAGSEQLDQSQTRLGNTARLPGLGGRGAGQLFVPRTTPLVRLDLQVRRRGDGRPGRVRIWRWRGDRRATTREAPLFEDTVELQGTNDWQLRSFFPGLSVEPGAPYYLELDAPGRGPFSVRAGLGPPDPYARGEAWPPHRSAKPLDLWFRTFGPSPAHSSAGTARAESETGGGSVAPDPELSWFPPKHGATPDRSDYLRRVERWTARRRQGVLRGCGSHAYHAAAFEAFLYRASCLQGRCDERRARDAATLLHRAHAWRFCSAEVTFDGCRPACEPEPKIGFAWLEPAGLAYRWIRDSPQLESKDHARIQALLADSARRAWPRRKRGSHNQSIRAASGFRLASDLVPDAPEARAWRRYADAVWEDFWSFRETEEDSTLYHDGVFWPSLLRYLEVAELTEKAWSDPAFRALVERFFRGTLALGAAPRYGDDVGWAYGQPGRIWLFEEAARRLGDPRYRWMARRLYAYHRDHARDDRPTNDAMTNHMLDLASAWLAAEDGPATPPEGRRRETVLLSAPSADAWTLEPGESLTQSLRFPGGMLSAVELRALDVSSPGDVAVAIRTGTHGQAPASGGETPLYEEVVGLEGATTPRALRIEPLLELPGPSLLRVEVRPLDTSLTLAGAAGRRSADAEAMLWQEGRRIDGALALRVERLVGWDASLTKRHRVESIPRQDRTSSRLFLIQPDQVPDKLVLRSGHDSRDLAAAFNLLAGYGHGHRELGALAALVDAGAVLVTQTAFPYANYAISPQDESVPLVLRFAGSSLGEPGREVRIPRMIDGRGAAVADIAFDDPFGWGVHQERRLALIKNRLLWVRDRFTPPTDLRAAVGPVWHAAALRATGPHWFDLFDPAPLGNVWRFRNPERYAWLGFVPRAGAQAAVRRVESYAPPPGCSQSLRDPTVKAECRAPPALVAYQRLDLAPASSSPPVLDSVWVPHGPEVVGEALASGLVVHYDDDDAVVLEIALAAERWILVDNPTRRLLRLHAVVTDARRALVLPGPSELRYALVLDATRLELPGVRPRRWSRPASAEIGELPANRPLP